MTTQLKDPNKRPLEVLKLSEIFPETKKKESRNHRLSNLISKAPFRILVAGPTGSGKSNFSISLIARKDMLGGFFKIIYLFSPNATYEDDNQLIKTKNPKAEVEFFDDTSEFKQKVDALIALQKKRKDEGKKLKKALIMVDDLVTDGKFMRSKDLNNLFVMGRKFGISLMLLTQRYKACQLLHRINCSTVIVFNQQRGEIDKMAEELGSGYYDKQFFRKIFNNMSPFGFLTINKDKPLDQRYLLDLKFCIKCHKQEET